MTGKQEFFTIVDSPIGRLLLTGDEKALTGLHMISAKEAEPLIGERTESADSFARATAQLDQYFAGERSHFDLELRPTGTDFQLAVWQALREIPFGETRSYGQVAASIGRPKAARAVGMANNRNPIAVIVPCHRVIGADGSMVGYGGGLDRKTLLLDLERGALNAQPAGARRAYSSSKRASGSSS